MKELLTQDLNWCARRLPKDVFALLKKKENKLFVAGGFIRACIANEKPSDVDIFSASKDFAELCARTLSEGKYTLLETDNAFTVYGKGRLSIQFIHKWSFEKPKNVIPSFDFTIAKAVIWFNGSEWQSLCDERFYPDLATKRLVYCSPKRIEEAGGSMLRVLKFYQRGYRIPLDSLAGVIARIVTSILTFSVSLKDESNITAVVSGLLREVDPLVDPNHLTDLSDTKKIEP